MSNLHKVFVSYHHELDETHKKIFEARFGDRFGAIIPGSVQVGDINPYLSADTIRQKIRDEYLRDTSVTVVLVVPSPGRGSTSTGRSRRLFAIRQPIRAPGCWVSCCQRTTSGITAVPLGRSTIRR